MNVDELETSHIVLVHGGGFGAWCWYKTIALLEECKFRVTAIDLTGSGIDLFNTNSIKSLSQYVSPLTDFLEKLADGEKVDFLSTTKLLFLCLFFFVIFMLFVLTVKRTDILQLPFWLSFQRKYFSRCYKIEK